MEMGIRHLNLPFGKHSSIDIEIRDMRHYHFFDKLVRRTEFLPIFFRETLA